MPMALAAKRAQSGCASANSSSPASAALSAREQTAHHVVTGLTDAIIRTSEARAGPSGKFPVRSGHATRAPSRLPGPVRTRAGAGPRAAQPGQHGQEELVVVGGRPDVECLETL